MTDEQRRAALATILRQWPIEELVPQPDEPEEPPEEEDINPYEHLFETEYV